MYLIPFVLGCLTVLVIFLWHIGVLKISGGALTMSFKLGQAARANPEQAQLRPEVLAFALMMERRMREKDAERGQSWKEQSLFGLSTAALAKASFVQSDIAKHNITNTTKHAVDIANFCMMLVDVCGELDNGGDGWAGLDQQPDEWRCA